MGRISNLLHLPVACHCKWAELIVIGETITMKPVHITLWLVVVCSLCLQASEAVTAADGGHPTEIAKLRAQLKDHAQLLTESRKREAETRKRASRSTRVITINNAVPIHSYGSQPLGSSNQLYEYQGCSMVKSQTVDFNIVIVWRPLHQNKCDND